MVSSPISTLPRGSGKRPLIYLASPYYHINLEARAWRVDAAIYATKKLNLEEYVVFSPIAYQAAWRGDIVWSHAKWLEFDLTFLAACDQMHVLKLPGWEKSAGVEEELKWCGDHDLPVSFINWTHQDEQQANIGPWTW